MSSVSDRDQWTVSTHSFHYRLYHWWRQLGGKGPLSHDPPRPIDLCHYMRVVMIWVWLRWFFVSRLRPWLWTGIAVIVGINAWSYRRWPATMTEVFKWYIAVIVGLVVIGGIIFLASLLEEGKKLERVGDALEWFFRKVFGAIARFLGPKFVWLGKTAIEPAGKWFFMRTLFWRIYPWMFVPASWFVLFAIIAPTGDFIKFILIVLGSVIGLGVCLGIIIAIVFLFEILRDGYRARRSEKEFYKLTGDPEPEAEPQVSQVREFLRLVWQYLVSRKHRICPFIVPTAGRTAVRKEGE